MEGFFFILAEDGKILFVSENVDKFIGFSQVGNLRNIAELIFLVQG
jgi:hypothetical protein